MGYRILSWEYPLNIYIIVALPYRAYPAATMFRPFWSTIWLMSVTPSGFKNIPKIDPIETKQSMLLEPSNGSNVTIYWKGKKSKVEFKFFFVSFVHYFSFAINTKMFNVQLHTFPALSVSTSMMFWFSSLTRAQVV